MIKALNLAVIASLGVAAVGLSSCRKDKEAPVISVSSPANHSSYAPGDEIDVQASFSDNEALSQYSVEVHEAGGHSHGGKVAAEWIVSANGDLSGTSQTVQLHIDIPTDAELADYHLQIDCLDVEGNEASEIVDFHVE